jgi:hypothetical protein
MVETLMRKVKTSLLKLIQYTIENRKIRHENEILKVNEPTHVPTHVQIYQIIPKTYHEIS